MNLFEISTHTKETEHLKYLSEFQTPHKVCKYMAELLPAFTKKVLEPTPGIGNLQVALENIGCEVTAPKDYFLLPSGKFDAVVMNPPFSSKYANMSNAPVGLDRKGMRLGYTILTECMQRSDIVIALMPWFTISDSDVRLRHLKKFGLKSLTALPRSTFKYARVQTVIIELIKGYKGQTEFKIFELINQIP